MIGLFGLLGLMLIGMALDASSSDDSSAPADGSNDGVSPNGGDDVETFAGGEGDDLVRGSNDVGLLYGENWDDAVIGGGNSDSVTGREGDDLVGSGPGDFGFGEAGVDEFVIEFLPGQTLPTVEEFNGSDDILVIYYNDPADQPVDFSFTDNGGSGQTEVTLFGQPALLVTGNAADIGLTIDSIVAVNTAVT